MQAQTRPQTPSNQIRKHAQDQTRRADEAAVQPVRHVHRQRDFGVGYGNSSGYASDRCYTKAWGNERFTCG